LLAGAANPMLPARLARRRAAFPSGSRAQDGRKSSPAQPTSEVIPTTTLKQPVPSRTPPPAGRARAPGQRRPDDVGQSLQHVDAHGPLAAYRYPATA
jgi:hypothetical protein